ncbi:MAG: DUF1294 domain-containing protein [Lachnospiraceae bacterium]|nr:DUF1294 domain-containing protein [Lachnospiraceae bacterium]
MLLLLYWIGMSVLAFVLFGVDKSRAKKEKRRIPEKRLIAVTVLGGAIGSGLGMLAFWHKIRKKKFYVTVPVCAVLTLLIAAGCFYMNLRITVSEYEYASDRVPAELDGFRIVQVSDLHNQFYGFHEQRLTDRIAELNPDIIVVTGDVVDKHFTNYKLTLEFFKGAVKIAPVYYVTGNHEVWLEGEKLDGFLRDVEALGVHMMDDRKEALGALTVVGIADESLPLPPDGLKSDGGFTICLAHEPSYYVKYRRLGADIVFTGHVHGGQVIVPGKGGLISPDIEFFPELYAGAHEYKDGEKTMTMYISRGLGNSVLPLRINNFPEIVVVALRHSE